MQRPLPRGLLSVGIVIDDLVVLEQILRSKWDADSEPSPFESCVRAERARKAYEDVGLRHNPAKGFSRTTKARFWGVEIDGEAGLLRCSSLRMWPTTVITMRVASLGLCSISLLEALAGSWVSLLGVRRRLYCCMDLIFDPLGSGCKQNDVVRLSDEMRSELVLLALMGPLAVVNLRADFAPFVAATDASGNAMAAVRAEIPPLVVQELSRHSLRKGCWSKLLPADKEWQRNHGLLAVEEELPEGEECFRSHPFWEVIARGLRYKEVWRKAANPRLHINVKEIRAHLLEEKRIANSRMSVRVPYGIDSQVSLGALVKGRASSCALNAEMRRTLPYVIGADLYALYMYFASSSNRADGPTREREPDAPDMELPSWWVSLASGDSEEFDEWIKRIGAPVETDGLDFSSIKCGPAPDLRTNAAVRKETFKQGAHGQVAGAQGSHSTTKAQAEVLERKEKETEHGLPKEIVEILQSFEARQFFFEGELRFDVPGGLDLFSGTCGVAKQMIKHGCPWVLTFEWKRGVRENLLDDDLRCKLVKLLRAGAFASVGAAPICSSFSIAITPPVRSSKFPRGKPGMRRSMRTKVTEGNSHNDFLADVLDICEELCLFFWVENLDSSFWWHTKRWRKFKDPASGKTFRLCFCRLGTPWRKATKIATNTQLAGLRMMCQCRCNHVQLRGTHPTRKVPWTLVAQPYPRGLNVLLATAVCSAVGWCEKRKLHLAGCAKVNDRVGEADHPGRNAARRNYSLETVNLLTPQTMALEARVLDEFLSWCKSGLPSCNVESVFDQVPLFLVQTLRCYGDLQFQRGGALSNFRHLCLAIQKWKPVCKPYMQSAWEIVDKWETQQPVKHRVPVPEVLLQAMVTMAWQFGWHRWCAATLLAYYGAGRLGEVLRCNREDLVLAEDVLEPSGSVAFLRLKTFKSLNRQPAKIQRMKVTHTVTCKILGLLYRRMEPTELLFDTVPYHYRKRWDAVLRAIGISSQSGFTPGGLRGGAAVYHYRNNTPISELMWKMRLRSQITLESYIQEVAALNSFARLASSTRQRILLLAAVFPHLVAAHGSSQG